MVAKKHIAIIGKTKQLVFEEDTTDPDQVHMAKEFEQVAATRPSSIQEFFIRLAALQAQPPQNRIRNAGRTVKPNKDNGKKKGRSL